MRRSRLLLEQGDVVEEPSKKESFEGRSILSATDEATGRRYWYEKVKTIKDVSKWPRWWQDPRPPPARPDPLFRVPPSKTRPSPTKRKYANVNKMLPGEPGYVFRPSVTLEVNVLRARNLINTDGRYGTSDPYAVVRTGPPHALQTIGRTAVVQNDLNPVFGTTPFRCGIFLDDECAETDLVIELWDSDLVGRDDALGMCTIQPREYLNATSPIRKMLRPQPGEAPVTGWVEVRVSLLARVCLSVETTGSDAMVFEPKVLGWRDATLPRQREGAAFIVEVPLQRAGCEFTIAAFEASSSSKEKPLGIGRVPCAELLSGQRFLDVALAAVSSSEKDTHESSIEKKTLVKLGIHCPDVVRELARAAAAARAVQETGNVLASLASVEIDVIRAMHVKKADAFSLSDPFVVGFSNGKKIGQTRTKNNTLNPCWEGDGPASTFRILKVRTADIDAFPVGLGGLPPTFDAMTFGVLLEVWDSDGAQSRGDFLGHAFLGHADLMVAGEKELTLMDRDLAAPEPYIAREGRSAKRRSCCLWRRLFCGSYPCDLLKRCFRRRPIRGKLLVRVRHLAQVKVRVLEGYGIGAAAVANPYVVVDFKGKTLARSRVMPKTRDPCFYAEVDVCLEVPQKGGTFGRKEEHELDRTSGLPWDHPGQNFQRASDDALLISVYDHKSLGADVFLGEVVLRPHVLLRPQNGTVWKLEGPRGGATKAVSGYLEIFIQASRVPETLEPCLRRQHGVLGTPYREAIDQQSGRKYYYDEWTLERFWVNPEDIAKAAGVLRSNNALNFTLMNEDIFCEAASSMKPQGDLTVDEKDPQAVIGLYIVRASGIEAKDSNGKSDPYAVVSYNGYRVGQTQVKKATLSPCWCEEVSVTVPLDGTSVNWSIELFDRDLGAEDDFIGEVHATTETLLESADQILTLPLCGRPGCLAATGELTIHVNVALKTVLEVVEAQRVNAPRQNKNDDGGFFCVASWTGRSEGEVARTSTVRDGQRPRWSQRFAIAVPLRFPSDRLRIEMREHVMHGHDKIIGRINIDADALLADAPYGLRFSLQDKNFDGLSKQHAPRTQKQRRRGAKVLSTKALSRFEDIRDDDRMILTDGDDDRDQLEEKPLFLDNLKDTTTHNVMREEHAPRCCMPCCLFSKRKKRHYIQDVDARVPSDSTSKKSGKEELVSKGEDDSDTDPDSESIEDVGEVISLRVAPPTIAMERYAEAYVSCGSRRVRTCFRRHLASWKSLAATPSGKRTSSGKAIRMSRSGWAARSSAERRP